MNDIKKLPHQFRGTGEVKGYSFIKIQESDKAFIYEKKQLKVIKVMKYLKRKLIEDFYQNNILNLIISEFGLGNIQILIVQLEGLTN